MRNTLYQAEDLKQFLITNTVATMQEMQAYLGTQVTKTVLRKLKALIRQLPVQTSHFPGRISCNQLITLWWPARPSEKAWCKLNLHF